MDHVPNFNFARHINTNHEVTSAATLASLQDAINIPDAINPTWPEYMCFNEMLAAMPDIKGFWTKFVTCFQSTQPLSSFGNKCSAAVNCRITWRVPSTADMSLWGQHGVSSILVEPPSIYEASTFAPLCHFDRVHDGQLDDETVAGFRAPRNRRVDVFSTLEPTRDHRRRKFRTMDPNRSALCCPSCPAILANHR